MKFTFLSLLIFQNITAGNVVLGMKNSHCTGVNFKDIKKKNLTKVLPQINIYSSGKSQESCWFPTISKHMTELKNSSIPLHYIKFPNFSKIKLINNCTFHFIGPKLAENVTNINDFLNHIELLQKSLFEFVDYMKNYESKMDDFSKRSVQKTKNIWLEHIKILNKKAFDVISRMNEKSLYKHNLFLPCEMGEIYQTRSNIKFFVLYETITYDIIKEAESSANLEKIKDFKSFYSIYNTLRCLGEMHTLDVQFSEDNLAFLDVLEKMFNYKLEFAQLRKEMDDIDFNKLNKHKLHSILEHLVFNQQIQYRYSEQIINKLVIMKLKTFMCTFKKVVTMQKMLYPIFNDASNVIVEFVGYSAYQYDYTNTDCTQKSDHCLATGYDYLLLQKYRIEY